MKLMFFLSVFIIKLATSEELEEVVEILEGKLKNPNIKQTVENLMEEYEFSENSIIASYKRCVTEEVEDENMMACFISGLYREKILETHKLMLCTSEYFAGTSLDCILSCFENYTPECLKCVGEQLPNLVDCILGLPYEFQ